MTRKWKGPEPKNKRTLRDWVMCRLGIPRCHRVLKRGIDYAMCNWCGRQSEVHEFGGPVGLPHFTCLVQGCTQTTLPRDGPFCEDHDWTDVQEEA